MAFKPIKPFLSYEKQVDNLINKKQLIIKNKDFALAKLQDVSYYSLIDGYKNLFYNPMTRKYETGTCFEDIVALYDFDKKLRTLIFQNICSIEQKIRSLISYHFCETYSENQRAYLNPHNYNNIKSNNRNVQRLIIILANEAIHNTEHAYVVYQRNTYGNVPLWVVINTLTIGQISKMYSLLTTSLQSKISMHFKNVNKKELCQYLKILTHFRNICAHNERLFSFKSRYEIPDTVLHRKMTIPRKGNHYICGKSDLFGIVIALRYLLSNDDFLYFKKNFTKLIQTFEKQSSNEKRNKLLEAMGLPHNWSSITKYRF